MKTSEHRGGWRQVFSLAVLWIGAALVALSCAGDGNETEPQFEELGFSGEGKLDAFGSIRSLYSDARNLDLGDLTNVGAGFATDGLNDALAFDNVAAEIGPPALYALSEEVEDDLTLQDIEELVSGLAARYGERELTTAVNALRTEHLRSSSDEVYAESAFSITGGFDHRWNLPAGGLEDVASWLGFDSRATLEARVIAPFENEHPANARVMLGALQEARGFVLPRSTDDIRSMSPGEAFALRGSGRLALNLGAGVPLLLVEPASSLTYNLVFSASLRTAVEGRLDVQLIRLDGDEVVLDVGVENASVRSARIAVEDGWGVQGLIDIEIEVGSHSVDLGRIAERAIGRTLNRNLNLVSARAESTGSNTRVSVARFRFFLDESDEEATQALAQALRGDVRLSQALANRGHGGVVAEFDLLRSGVSSVSHAGIDLFGMSFFSTTEEREGSIVVQTPGGAATYLFDSLHEERGWFFSTHGYTRVGLAGLVFDPDAPGRPRSETNLFVQIVEGDDYMERDKIVDHLDGIISSVGGAAALRAIEDPGNELQQYVQDQCRPPIGEDEDPWDPCRTEVLVDSHVIALREAGASALAESVSHLEEPLRELVLEAGALRLATQATYQPGAALVGPPTSVVVDFRLDDAALAEIARNRTQEDFWAALRTYLEAHGGDRYGTPSELDAERAEVIEDQNEAMTLMGAAFHDYADLYDTLLDAESSSITGVGALGPNTIEIHYAVDAENRVLYEEATARSLAQARAQVATEMFDALVEVADDLDCHPEQAVGYALLALTDPRRTDLRVDIQMDLDDSWAQSLEHYREAGYHSLDVYGRGSRVSFIGGGLFDIDALLTVDR